ncbi:MAG TPA: sensor histidine kinase [Bacillus sp. (in: firmicutes)]|nr:sensor histidine kinase [Bacillus sp. (in: firmicutes)]
MRLHHKLILLIGLLLFSVVIVMGAIFHDMEVKMIKEQIGQRALTLAETIALTPEIQKGFNSGDPSQVIQPFAENIRKKTGAEFIVVGNKEGIRYSHPIPERLGRKMVGGDNEEVLKGKSIISEAVGSLGPSLRGKAPVFNQEKQVIGIVSVGFSISDIEEMTDTYRNRIVLFALLILIIGAFGAMMIAYGVDKALFGLRPKEIGRLYMEKQAILESIREGLIAVNAQGDITMINHSALDFLGLEAGSPVLGKNIFDVLPNSRLLEVIRTGEAEYDQEMMIGENIVVANRLPVRGAAGVIGAVASFRNKSELYRLTEELSQVKRYAEALRAQTHEYSNKLYMISGLIQLESYQEAIELITRESDIHQNLFQFIMKEIPDPMIGGLLIGKFNRASELKVQLEIDRESSFKDVPHSMDRGSLVTIIGNLIDNAMEATFENGFPAKCVKVFFTDLGEDLIIEVEDNGSGISEEQAARIFDLGFSTKSKENRGFGLALVKQAIERLGGYITFDRGDTAGTVFTVAIPKQRQR